MGISIHALLAESDAEMPGKCKGKPRFLSTLSLRRATVYAWHGHQRRAISIHALLAESDLVKKEDFDKVMSISIHALLAESDAGFTFCARGAGQFLSTLSLRRATLTLCVAS